VGLAVDGRPADCVKLAVSALWPERVGAGSRPDIVISGMNAGANCGINVIYSGTVAAAIEGAFLGIPSIAVSMRMSLGKARFDLGARRARAALDKILEQGKPRPYEVLSVNVPSTQDATSEPRKAEPAFDPLAKAHTDPMTLPPIRVCPMNTHGLIDKYERRVNPMGEVYYWAAGHGLDFHSTELDSDVDLLKYGYTTVTPLRFDLTNHVSVDFWRERIEQAKSGH
jgi:5'-nucleotidase